MTTADAQQDTATTAPNTDAAGTDAADTVTQMNAKKEFSDTVAKNHSILRIPHITERSYQLQEIGKYVFTVAPKATKADVKKAVEDVYDVSVTSVNIVRRKPKAKVFRGRAGTRSGVKRAIVTLKKGQEIKLVETA